MPVCADAFCDVAALQYAMHASASPALGVAILQACQESKVPAVEAQSIAYPLPCCTLCQQVKAAMIDSAHAAVAQLKAELAELQQEADDSQREAKEAVNAAVRASEAAAAEAAALRSEMAAGEAAIEHLEQALAVAQARAQEADAKSKAVQETAAEKDSMIK